jgi:uncharacterized membrane protein YeiH
MSTETFSMVLEHAAVGVAALTGVLAVRGKQVDLFGVLVLAVVTAFGGGTLRDLMVGDVPVIWVRAPHLLVTATGVAVVAFFVVRAIEPPLKALMIADAFVLALFTTVGAKTALRWNVAPAVVVALGVITGVAGGIIRDTLTGEIPLVFRREIHLYATASLVGAVVLVTLHHFQANDSLSAAAGTVTTLALRLAGIRWKIGLPVFHTEPKETK